MGTVIRNTLLLLAAALIAIPASSDSDGSFCLAKGYLAYEVQAHVTPDAKGHILKVVRFDARQGIYPAGEKVIEDFIVHKMVCGQDQIEISGWSRFYERYLIDIKDPKNVHVIEHSEDPSRKFDPSKDGREPRVLWDEHGPASFSLESVDPDHRYELVITRWDKEVEGGFEHHSKAEVTRLDLQGKVLQGVLSYENTSLESGLVTEIECSDSWQCCGKTRPHAVLKGRSSTMRHTFVSFSATCQVMTNS